MRKEKKPQSLAMATPFKLEGDFTAMVKKVSSIQSNNGTKLELLLSDKQSVIANLNPKLQKSLDINLDSCLGRKFTIRVSKGDIPNLSLTQVIEIIGGIS
jgi:hypothetical protein